MLNADPIAVAGASGFVGQALGAALARAGRRPWALTRGRASSASGPWQEVRQADLFDREGVAEALRGARTAVYLVHSMMPSARLVQGDFADLDLICADNFGRAARHAGVAQIVYLGGLLPSGIDGPLSAHLASRQEVESALASHGVPVTTLRAGLIIGPGGSSWQILERLVRRLPWMLCPRWTAHRCQPIDLDTAVALLAAVVGRAAAFGQTYDIGGPEVLTYRDMMVATAARLGLRRRMRPVPLLTPRLSAAWVSMVTGAPGALVRPLVESLRHDMVCGDRRLQDDLGLPGRTFGEAIDACAGAAATEPRAYRAAPVDAPRGVRSVQRLPLPPGRDAAWAARRYLAWLPRGVVPWLRVDLDAAGRAVFRLRGTSRPLLVLRFAAERSGARRQWFEIADGALVAKGAAPRGCLEFRVTPDGRSLLTAIHDYLPRLPWLLYRLTQAPVHRWVMRRFGRDLARLRSVDPEVV